MAFTDQKIDFPNFREGWGVAPETNKAHYYIRIDPNLCLVVQSACGLVDRFIDHHGNGYGALWAPADFTRCKTCQRIRP